MSIFNLFRRKAAAPKKEEPAGGAEELEYYSGLRVEVTTFDGRLLFVAKLLGLHGNHAELHQYSEAALPQTEEPIPVRIRGYSDQDRKAVYMEGAITPKPKNICAVSDLKLCKAGNDRAFFRLDVNLDATATMFSGLAMGEKPCRLLNISVGGACISSEYRYHQGDKFLLKVRLLQNRPESVMFSQVMRVIEKDEARFEYGCRFLELTEDDQEKITQNIFEAQRQKRARS